MVRRGRLPSQVSKFKRVEKSLTDVMQAWATVDEEINDALEGKRTKEPEAEMLRAVQAKAHALHKESAGLFHEFRVGVEFPS